MEGPLQQPKMSNFTPPAFQSELGALRSDLYLKSLPGSSSCAPSTSKDSKCCNNLVLSTLVAGALSSRWIFKGNQPKEGVLSHCFYSRECFLFPEGLTFLWFSGLSSEVSV